MTQTVNERIVTAAAELAHEANRILCAMTRDDSQVAWAKAPDWQRESAHAGVKTALSGATPQQQHEAWCRDKHAGGWVYGAVKDPAAKTHPCLVPYTDLPAAQRAKDALYGAVVRAMAAACAEAGIE